MSGTNIGMMDPAYFLGRKAIIDWLNTTFQFNLSKIEETASGAVCCQLLDAIYPGEVSVQRVRWDAKSPHEFIDNYKVIQSVFEKKGVDKYLGEWRCASFILCPPPTHVLTKRMLCLWGVLFERRD
jgi:RP/EB family microtubule-associated protein